LENTIGEAPADIYLGGYGNFDSFAYQCAKKYKSSHPDVKLVFVSPYYDVAYQRNYLHYQKSRYDLIVYPSIEDKPKRFAIIYRNRYMVDMADVVIAYIDHNTGGAYQTYKYAKRNGKVIYNLAQKDI
jgi:uncharacterized phage-like protein YoqJ